MPNDANLVARPRPPPAGCNSSFAAAGALIGYGVHIQDLFRRAGSLTDKILKGAKPADVPVEIASAKGARSRNSADPASATWTWAWLETTRSS